MIEPISTTILRSFIIGIVIGIFEEINKKINSVIWILAVVVLIISISIQGVSLYSSGLNWGVGNWIAIIITISISVQIGRLGLKNLKEAFK